MFIHWHLQSDSDLDKLIKDVDENEAPDDAPQLPKELENPEGITFIYLFSFVETPRKFIIANIQETYHVQSQIYYHITIWAPY